MPPSPTPTGLNEITVTCRQCGGADMVRLDRKEYRCKHCGAITVLSDNDAERLEALLRKVLYEQANTGPQLPLTPLARRRPALVLAFIAVAAGLAIAAATTSLFPHHNSAATASENSLLDDQTVRNTQVTLSSLQWTPDESPGPGFASGGSYNGILYNHSGYAITPPTYTLNLFRGGMKGDSASNINQVSTLEPGEYEPISFRFPTGKPGDRYEVTQPDHIGRSSNAVVAVKLQQPVLVHAAGSAGYSLVGVVRNTLRQPISGLGELMLYGRDGQVIASGTGSVDKLMPGEQTVVTLNAFKPRGDVDITAYEYLLDVSAVNMTNTVTLEEWQKAGRRTVPNRIVRVDHPRMQILPSGTDVKPEDFVARP